MRLWKQKLVILGNISILTLHMLSSVFAGERDNKNLTATVQEEVLTQHRAIPCSAGEKPILFQRLHKYTLFCEWWRNILAIKITEYTDLWLWVPVCVRNSDTTLLLSTSLLLRLERKESASSMKSISPRLEVLAQANNCEESILEMLFRTYSF